MCKTVIIKQVASSKSCNLSGVNTKNNKKLGSYSPFLINFDWKKIFKLPGIACNEYKLQSLQYSILHRYFYCNHNLHLWQLVDSPDWDYCHVVDNIEHFFFYCETVHNIWNCIKRLIVQCFQINIKVTVLEVLLSIPCEKYTALNLINFIFLYVKWYIYQTKKGNNIITFKSLSFKLKNRIETEIVSFNCSNIFLHEENFISLCEDFCAHLT